MTRYWFWNVDHIASAGAYPGCNSTTWTGRPIDQPECRFAWFSSPEELDAYVQANGETPVRVADEVEMWSRLDEENRDSGPMLLYAGLIAAGLGLMWWKRRGR